MNGPGGQVDRLRSSSVLMYHLIGGAEGGDLAVTAKDFADHLDTLADNGLRGCSMAELMESPDRAGLVGITFDDAFRTGLPLVADLLLDHDFSATVFVPTAFVSGPATWIRDDRSSAVVMDWKELAALRAAGFECGSHSVGHVALDLCTPQEGAAQVTDSKRTIEDQVGGVVTSFAYPFGYHDRRTKRWLAAAGYTSACAIRHDRFNPSTDHYSIPRFHARNGTAWLQRAIDPSTKRSAESWAKQLAYPGWRLVRRSEKLIRSRAVSSPST
jgi:peptidoglycan/xylan/chitin deacetylase (PgdA/CDA1 family)